MTENKLINFYVLNGPPGSGKDALAEYVANNHIEFCVMSFKGPLLDFVSSLGVDVDNEGAYRAWKNSTIDDLTEITGRQLMIDFSEDFFKPRLGKDIFARLLLDRARREGENHVIVPDGGFNEEIDCLCSQGNVSVHLFHLHRPGKTFEGDSRKYLTGYPYTEIHNNSTIPAFLHTGAAALLRAKG